MFFNLCWWTILLSPWNSDITDLSLSLPSFLYVLITFKLLAENCVLLDTQRAWELASELGPVPQDQAPSLFMKMAGQLSSKYQYFSLPLLSKETIIPWRKTPDLTIYFRLSLPHFASLLQCILTVLGTSGFSSLQAVPHIAKRLTS